MSNGSATVYPNSFIHGTTDTLVVSGDYSFYVNGHLLDDTTFSQGLNFNAVGLYVDSGASVEVEQFSAGINPGTAIARNSGRGVYAAGRPRYILGGSGIIYDTRGRKVATFKNGYKETLKNLSTGPYLIVVPGRGSNQGIRQAIINNP
jgi:hypothetical protein